MNIIFVIPDIKHSIIQFPIGELNTATILKQCGHDVSIVDLRLSKLRNNLTTISNSDIIFISSSTYDFTQCYCFEALDITSNLMTHLRRVVDKPIYLIGAHGTVLPKPTLKYTNANGIIRGEFESNVAEFICNYSVNKNKKIFPAKCNNIYSFDPNSITADYSLIDATAYYGDIIRNNRITTGKCALILGNRGCPYSCEYCYNFFGKLRIRKPKVIIREIDLLYQHCKFRDYFFLDYTFTASPKWVFELCDFIIKSKMKISWMCQTRCDAISPTLLEIMQNAGCSGIWYGVENPFNQMSGKYINSDMVEKCILNTRKFNIVPILFLQLFLPNDNEERILNLIKWTLSLDTYFIVSPFVPRPGSVLFPKLTRRLKGVSGWDKVDYAIAKNQNNNCSFSKFKHYYNILKNSKWFV